MNVELTRSTGNPLQDDPPKYEHGRMVIDMKKGQLPIFLPDNDKHRVKQFDNFAKQVRPHVFDDLEETRKLKSFYMTNRHSFTSLFSAAALDGSQEKL